jgi:hypothetical protein
MFKLDNPDAVQSLSMMGGKTWHLQPGTLEVHGNVPGLPAYVIPEGVGFCQDVSDQGFCWFSASV